MFLFSFLFLTQAVFAKHKAEARIQLHNEWQIQDSNLVRASGEKISQDSFEAKDWLPATVPSTILANLAGSAVGTGTSSDPYYGKNWLKLPGSGEYYPIGKNYGEVATPKESPFGRGWWYRKEFSAPAKRADQFVDINFAGITYGAEIWLNGKKLAGSAETRGSYRHFSYDITPFLKSEKNIVAVEVFPPGPTDLTPSWVDWNPTPQDKNMGLWREVTLHVHGAVSIEAAQVQSEINFPSASSAALTVEANLVNWSNQAFEGEVSGSIGDIQFTKTVKLAAKQKKIISFRPAQYPQLQLAHPKLWWPWQMGNPDLYHLSIQIASSSALSDQKGIDFGIRKIDSKLTADGYRLYSVNEKPILIRGGGWASDLLLRFNPTRAEQELEYVKALGLNTVRLEGRFEPEYFLTLADKKGILLMPGWVCCNAWQEGKSWTADKFPIAQSSLFDQAMELRSHPSVFVFLYGSDEAPNAKIEKLYLEAFKSAHWPNPILSSASDRTTDGGGATGVKMNGPYAYTPPSYWYVDTKYGGAWGFNTETSPGVSIPPMESLKSFIPPENFSKLDDVWSLHAGENDFKDLTPHLDAVKRRYGEVKDLADFIKKSQVMDYDNHRAMFEAFGKNKYHSATGIVQWMLNSAWPSTIWHLYDFFLRPGAAYYGVMNANKPLHVQYSLDDQSVVVVNSTYSPQKNLHVYASIYDASLKLLSKNDAQLSLAPDASAKAFVLAGPSETPKELYFVKLELRDENDVVKDNNFYWLSTKQEAYAWPLTDFKRTPIISEANLSALQDLPPTILHVESSWDEADGRALVKLTNTGAALAFFTHLKLTKDDQELLPVFWSDNYISLMPGETRTLTVSVPNYRHRAAVEIHGEAWNVPAW